ncbi:MAG: zinc ribbon domain-containing protein [Acidobacteriota bacterium]
MICPKCGADNKPSLKICRVCATPLVAGPITPVTNREPGPGEMFCSSCKTVNDAKWMYCQHCGEPLHKAGMSQPIAAPIPVVVAQQAAASATAMPVALAHTSVQVSSPAGSSISSSGKHDSFKPSKLVTCPKCERVNISTNSFCVNCGDPIPVVDTLTMGSPNSSPARLAPKLRLIEEGGGEGEVYRLHSNETVIGRNTGDIRFPYDAYVSSRHARIERRGEQYVIVDENSRNGIFKQIHGEAELKHGDLIRIGKQLFRFELNDSRDLLAPAGENGKPASSDD